MFFLTPRVNDPFDKEGILEYPLAKLLVFTEHKDSIRRGGVAATIKYVRECFHVSKTADSPQETARFTHLHIARYSLQTPRRWRSHH